MKSWIAHVGSYQVARWIVSVNCHHTKEVRFEATVAGI